MSASRIIQLVVGVVLLLFVSISIGNVIEWSEAQEYIRIQYPNGSYAWYLTPGPHPQWWGSVVRYPQRGTIFFKQTEEGDARLPIVFNEGGTAKIAGSINYELPANEAQLSMLHAKYPNQQALEASLVKPALNNSIYLTGTLMTSYESYKERRNQLVQYVTDTVQNGVYQTDSREVEVTDELDPTKKKRVTVVEILRAPAGTPNAGQPLRADQGQLNVFGVRTFNFSIEGVDYDDTVTAQIQGQQKITMQVQTSIAEAKQAEQKKLTVEAEGAANAAQAKWEQEKVKAQQVTLAQQKLEVATLDNSAAEQERQAILKRASGEAEARRLKMQADGALEQKLKAYVDVNHGYAAAIQGYKGNWVPMIQTGGGTGSGAGGGAQALIDLLTARTAQQLGVDATPGNAQGR